VSESKTIPSIFHLLRRTTEPLLSLIYPPHCAICNADTEAGRHLCDACKSSARKITAPFCEICSQQFDGAIDTKFSCANCHGRAFHFSCAVAGYRATGVVREVIHRFKYSSEFHLRHQLAEWLADTLDDERIRAVPVDALVPVPLHTRRFREREFNQADALARLLAARTGLKISDCLRRTRYTTTQTRFSRDERIENLRDAFALRKNTGVRDMHLVLVDDVLTTGTTLDECARVLRKAGATSVRAITVARG
jgi:competence protein ComFC